MDEPTEKKKRKRRSAYENRPVGVAEVAREAGVSVASVSRVVNKPEMVAAKTRARVQAAIARLNYVPDGAGRALITGRSRLVGAIIPHIQHSVYAAFLESLQSRLAAQNYHLIVAMAGFDRANEYQQVWQMLAGGAEALMLAGQQRDPAIYKLLDGRRIPYVLSSVYYPDSVHPCVGYDNRGAAAMTARYLLDLGHTRIATITGNAATTDRVAERIKGIRDALAGHGLGLHDDWICEGYLYSLRDGRAGMRRLMSGAERPTAVIGGNDVMAVGAMLEARAMGIRVPEEVSITGFDNTELASQFVPSLTTVHVPVEQMGRRAGDYLLGCLAGETLPAANKVDVDLVVRESTGPAPRDAGG